MVWHGVVYGVVWHGVVWHGVVWYGVVWYGMVLYGMVLYGVLCYGMVWWGMVWCCILLYDMLQYGVVWYGYGMVWYGVWTCGMECGLCYGIDSIVWYNMIWYSGTIALYGKILQWLLLIKQIHLLRIHILERCLSIPMPRVSCQVQLKVSKYGIGNWLIPLNIKTRKRSVKVKIWVHHYIFFSTRSTQKCIRTMSSGYCLSSFFVPGDRHVVVGTKVNE
jgi:hypothetical protein